MGDNVNVNTANTETTLNTEVSISEFVEGRMAKFGLKAAWLTVGAVITFLLVQFLGLSTIVHEFNGKQTQMDQTINMLLDERGETFSTLLDLQQQLMEENQNLRNQLDNQKD